MEECEQTAEVECLYNFVTQEELEQMMMCQMELVKGQTEEAVE